MSSDPTSVIVHTLTLLLVAVLAVAVGSLHGRLEAARSLLASLQAALDVLRGEHAVAREDQARDRQAVAAVRAAVRRLDAEAPELQDEPEEPRVGFRLP